MKKKKKTQRHKSALASSPVWSSSVFLLMLLLGWDKGNGWHGDGCGRKTTRLPVKRSRPWWRWHPVTGYKFISNFFPASWELQQLSQAQLEVWNVLRDEVLRAHGCSKGAGLALAVFLGKQEESQLMEGTRKSFVTSISPSIFCWKSPKSRAGMEQVFLWEIS